MTLKSVILSFWLIAFIVNSSFCQQRLKNNNNVKDTSVNPNHTDQHNTLIEAISKNDDNVKDTSVNPNHTDHHNNTLIETILDSLAQAVISPKKPTEKNARIAYEFKQFKIYPSEDALQLLYILNPWLKDAGEEIPTSRFIKIPDFPSLGKEKRKALKADYKTALKPNSSANIMFDSLVTIFNERTPELQVQQEQKNSGIKQKLVQKKLQSKLEYIKTNVIPDLNRVITRFYKAKSDYINATFANLVDNLKNKMDAQVLEDAADDFLKAAGYNYVAANNIHEESFLANNSKKSVSFFNRQMWQAANNINIPEDNATVIIKCCIYIYNEKGKIISQRFDVYFRPFVSTYSLKYCKNYYDTVQYVSRGSWNAINVTPGAVVIPNNSNWAVYFKDTYAPHVYTTGSKYSFQNLPGNKEDDEDFYRVTVIYHGK